jgi:hypothetical protein
MKNEISNLLSELKKINNIENKNTEKITSPKKTQLNIALDEIKLLALNYAKEEQQFDEIKELAKKKHIENIKKEKEISEQIKINKMYDELKKENNEENHKLVFDNNINFNTLKLNDIKKINNKNKISEKNIIIISSILLFITCFCFTFFIFKDVKEEIKLNENQIKKVNIKIEKKIINLNEINIQIFPIYVFSFDHLKEKNYYDLFLFDFLYNQNNFSKNEKINKKEKNKNKKINKNIKKAKINFDLKEFDIK